MKTPSPPEDSLATPTQIHLGEYDVPCLSSSSFDSQIQNVPMKTPSPPEDSLATPTQIHLGEYDVPCLQGVRGPKYRDHAGRNFFAAKIDKEITAYATLTTRGQRMKMSKRIVREMNVLGSRFLKYNKGQWEVYPENKARDKVTHALRAALSRQQGKSSKKFRKVFKKCVKHTKPRRRKTPVKKRQQRTIKNKDEDPPSGTEHAVSNEASGNGLPIGSGPALEKNDADTAIVSDTPFTIMEGPLDSVVLSTAQSSVVGGRTPSEMSLDPFIFSSLQSDFTLMTIDDTEQPFVTNADKTETGTSRHAKFAMTNLPEQEQLQAKGANVLKHEPAPAFPLLSRTLDYVLPCHRHAKHELEEHWQAKEKKREMKSYCPSPSLNDLLSPRLGSGIGYIEDDLLSANIGIPEETFPDTLEPLPFKPRKPVMPFMEELTRLFKNVDGIEQHCEK